MFDAMTWNIVVNKTISSDDDKFLPARRSA